MSDLTLKLPNGNTLHGNDKGDGKWVVWVVSKATSKVVGRIEVLLGRTSVGGLMLWGNLQDNDVHKDFLK